MAVKIKGYNSLGGLADAQLPVSAGCVNVCPGQQQKHECLPEGIRPVWGKHLQGSAQPRV